jgi:hypothetical protein
MIFLKSRTSIVAVLSLILILAACRKEKSDQSIEKALEPQYKRTSGVVEDDANLVSKIPVIMSSDLLNRTIKDPSLLIAIKGKPTGGNDATPPTISISSPVNGATVSGTISVTVNATDNRGVSSVSLSVDGNLVGSSTSSPFTISWNSATVINGTHTLTVKAKDAAGNIASASTQVMVSTVSNTDVNNPTVNITSPTSGASVAGTVDIAANASDNVGVSSVKFSIDGVVVGSDNNAPYNFSWSTTSVATGIHTVTATAYDAAGNNSAQSINVTVNTTVINPPALPASAQLLMPPVRNQGGEFSCVAFAAGYAARSAEQFYKTGASGYNNATNIFSSEFLYNQTKFGDCGAGTSVTTVLEFIKTYGICSEQSMPYSDLNGCSLLPNSSQSAEAANYKINSYSVISKSDITAIKTMIVNKHPLILTVNLDASFTNAQPGFIWKSYSGADGFGHALVICGYDDSKHAFKVMNSWGTSWGDAGYSWIDYDFLAQTGGMWTFVINN